MFRKTMIRLAAGVGVASLVAFGASAANASVVHHGALSHHVAFTAPRPLNTGSCGFGCVEPYFLQPGTGFIQQASGAKANNAVHTYYADVTNKNEDWFPTDVGTVIPEYCPGTPSDDPGALAIDPVFTANQCNQLALNGLDTSTAWQLRFSPLGVDTHLCSGVWNNGKPQAGSVVRLSACGVNGDTVWIADSALERAGDMPYINGGSNNFSDPLVITEGNTHNTPQTLRLQPVDEDTAGIVASTQLVGILPGL